MSRSTERLRSRRGSWALVLLLALIAARLGFSALAYARPELSLANDTDRYVPIANAILAGKAYGWNTQHPGELLNTVGYPLFLAGVFALVGQKPGDVALAQLVLSGALAVVLYLVLARIFGTMSALVSAILLAVDPLSILWSLTMLTETFFAVTLGIGAIMLTEWADSHNTKTLLLAGFFAGLSCLVKPFALLIVAVWAVALVFFAGPQANDGTQAVRGGFRKALLFVLPTVILVVPWFVRNTLLWDCPTLSSVDRVTMRDYVAGKILAEYEHIPLEAAQARLQEQDPGVCPHRTGEYVGLIMAHPQIYATLHVAGTIPVLLGTSFDRWMQFFGSDYVLPDLWQPFMDGGLRGLATVLQAELVRNPAGILLMAALTAFQLLVYALALRGLLTFPKLEGGHRWTVIVLLAAVLILVLTPGQGGHERFRVAAQPPLMILACYGIARRGVSPMERPRALTEAPPPRGSSPGSNSWAGFSSI